MNFKEGSTYEIGAFTAAHQQSGDIESPRYPANSGYPKVYQGDYLINRLNAPTAESYLLNNPDNLKPNKVLHFYEVSHDGQTKKHVFQGMLHPRSESSTLGDTQGNQQTPPAMTMQHQPEERSSGLRARVQELTDENMNLRDELASTRQRNAELSTELNSLRSRVLDVEREKLKAEAEIQLATERGKNEAERVKQEYETRIKYLEETQTARRELLETTAYNKAVEAIRAENAATLNDNEESGGLKDAVIEMVKDNMDTILPVAMEIGKGVASFLSSFRKPQQPPLPPPDAAAPTVAPPQPPQPPHPMAPGNSTPTGTPPELQFMNTGSN